MVVIGSRGTAEPLSQRDAGAELVAAELPVEELRVDLVTDEYVVGVLSIVEEVELTAELGVVSIWIDDRSALHVLHARIAILPPDLENWAEVDLRIREVPVRTVEHP